MAAPPIDLRSGEFYGVGARQAYAWMRRSSPVHFDHNSGLWGIATYDSVLTAERDPVVFSNAGGSRPDTGPLPWMIDMDDPAHLERRRLVNRGFSPGRVRASEGRVGEICDGLIDRVCERGRCDAVRDLAAPLPMVIIGDMLGVPPEDRADLLRWSHDLLASMSSSEHIEAAAVAFTAYSEYARAMIAARRERPTDDLVSVLVHAEVDDEQLDEDEIVFETLLLLVGGDETTRHVISGGLEQLLLNPGEKQKVLDGSVPMAIAVEEMLRWVSPIKNMCRTVTDDVELGGQHLRAGEKALLLYESANFDDTHFDEPERFTVDRLPNDHLAFGFGPHFCLGASLARLELHVMFDRILRRLPDLELAVDGPLPHPLTGIEELPVRFTPTGRVGS
ncbi:MAG: cytochrome P450 [Actinomycetota bacterium]|nr:cytochrome P450 [Actinomycetota bacterium]